MNCDVEKNAAFPPENNLIAFWKTGCALLLLLTVSACSTLPTSRGPGGATTPESEDGPPSTRVDVSRIPDAVPRDEPHSVYGNPSSYEVEGKRYNVMASSEGYVERGIASWYGTKFHGKRTSSGEPYDMHAMTAAHTTLPIPTYAEVTNLQNGRKVIVKINDRGPFRRNRLIDLSYVAAVKLGITGEGTGLVEVRAINPGADGRVVNSSAERRGVNPSAEGRIVNAAGSNPSATVQTPMVATPTTVTKVAMSEQRTPVDIYLQVGAFTSRDNAERLAQRVKPLREASDVEIQSGANARPGATIYRVRIGPLSGVDEVDRLSRRLSDLGVVDTQVVIN